MDVLLAGFSALEAVALSNMTILGGSLANFGVNIRKKHPRHDGPLIDWNFIVMMEPMTVMGVLAGGYANKVPCRMA
jgi:uncharacterized membrane protein YfcA